MDIEFIPRSRLIGALSLGYRLIPGWTYDPADYAILMCRPEPVADLSPIEAGQIVVMFQRPGRSGPVPNKMAGYLSRVAAHG